jgi:hypothetical protein
MHISTAMRKRIMRLTVLAAMVGMLVNGCDWFKDDKKHGTPTTPQIVSDCGEFFCYQATQTAGVTIMVDMNQGHIAGQPYGNWFVKAEWLTPEKTVISEQLLPVAIDAAGKGTAYLPPAFVSAVLAAVNADTGVLTQRPGLKLGFFPDDNAWQYYQFD